MLGLSRVTSVGRGVVAEFRAKNVTFMAGSIAYSAFVSLAPLLLLVFLAVRFFGGSGWRREVQYYATRYLSPGLGHFVVDAARGRGKTGLSFVGFVVVVWGALKIFRHMDTAFSEIYETNAENPLSDQVKDGLVVTVALVVGVVAAIAASAAFAYVRSLPYVGVLSPVLLVVGLSIVFFPLFYVFPDTDIDVREVVPGVVFAATGWAVLQALFQVYASYKLGGGDGETAFLGAVVLLVTWLYFGGLVLLLGAVINAVVGGHTSSVTGGIGKGAARPAPEREIRLDHDRAAAYLTQLREDVTGRYEGMQPTADGSGRTRSSSVTEQSSNTDSEPRNRPAPDGEIEIVEREITKSERDYWEVRLQWPKEHDTDDESGSSDRNRR